MVREEEKYLSRTFYGIVKFIINARICVGEI